VAVGGMGVVVTVGVTMFVGVTIVIPVVVVTGNVSGFGSDFCTGVAQADSKKIVINILIFKVFKIPPIII